MKKCGMRDSREKGAGMRDQDPHPHLPRPFPDPGSFLDPCLTQAVTPP